MSTRSRFRRAIRAAVLASPALLSTSLSAHAAPAVVRLSGHVPAALLTAQKTGDVAPATRVPLAISLPLRNTHELGDFVKNIYDPKSSLYGKYLTPAQFAARFGPTPADYQAVIAYAKSQGLTVTHTFTARTVLDVAGSASAVQKAFGVHLNTYIGKDKKPFFSTDSEPAVPLAFSGKIDSIVGLSNVGKLKPQHIVLTPQQRTAALAKRDAALKAAGTQAKTPQFGFGHGHFGAYTPTDLQVGYNVDVLPFTGSKQAIGVFALGGFLQSDIDTYRQYYSLPNVPVKVVSVDGYGGGVDDPDVALEADLDIDMQTALAPGASEIRVYEAPAPYPQGLVDALAVAADENKVAQMSISYGEYEDGVGVPTIKAEFNTLMQMAAQGQTVFASAGDNGAYADGQTVTVLDPSSQPYITSVGGTELYEFPDSSYYAEVTWNGLGIGDGATGGGVSLHHSIPFYQKGTMGLASTTKRNVPDISAVADPITGVDVYSAFFEDANGNFVPGFYPVGGTSASAPIWAGFAALVNQARASAGLPRLGFANPGLYAIGNSFLSPFDLHDILDGTNGNASLYGAPGYAAGVGYDNATGFGSMIGGQILGDLASPPLPNTTPPGPITGLSGTSTSSSVTLHYTAAKNAKGYFVFISTDGGVSVNLVGVTKNTYFKVSGLASGTTYQFYVGAVNGTGITYSDALYLQTK